MSATSLGKMHPSPLKPKFWGVNMLLPIFLDNINYDQEYGIKPSKVCVRNNHGGREYWTVNYYVTKVILLKVKVF